MSWLQVILLALIQGVTEFLPISSSAHLILLPHVAGWQDQGLLFDIATNTGTLLAVMVYFRSDLLALARDGLATLGQRPSAWSPQGRLAWWILLGTVPVAACGLLFYDWIAGAARDPAIIATTSIVFGLALWVADRWGRRRRSMEQVTGIDVAVVGLLQALALVPGTSRSGITITGGLLTGLTRPAAARLSFLLAVPVSLLAAAKDLWDVVQNPVPSDHLLQMAVALLLAAVSAYLVIDWLLRWLQRQSLTLFVVYRVLLGVVIFGWLVAG